MCKVLGGRSVGLRPKPSPVVVQQLLHIEYTLLLLLCLAMSYKMCRETPPPPPSAGVTRGANKISQLWNASKRDTQTERQRGRERERGIEGTDKDLRQEGEIEINRKSRPHSSDLHTGNCALLQDSRESNHIRSSTWVTAGCLLCAAAVGAKHHVSAARSYHRVYIISRWVLC